MQTVTREEKNCKSTLLRFTDVITKTTMKFCCFGRRHSLRYRNGISSGQTSELLTEINVRLFSHNALKSATDDFHPKNKIGGGGFGVVYRGMLKDNTQVAIKCLSAGSRQGTREFLTELDLISYIEHPNLVQLIGCCIEGDHRILVYEYLENNSLATTLLGSASKRMAMDWRTRAAICMGNAKGLSFLHEEAEPHIVHRDIKASNVLLGRNLIPKIGDFGLAKLFPDNVTHISTRVAGTVGYLAPEYALLGQLTKKADIYSFGVLILEIISGRNSTKAIWGEEMTVLLEWTWNLREGGKLLEIVDPELSDYPAEEVMRFIKVALFCTQAASQQRPSMKRALEMLSSETTLDVSTLTPPGVMKNRNSDTSIGSWESSQAHRALTGQHFLDRKPSPGLHSSSFALTQLQPR